MIIAEAGQKRSDRAISGPWSGGPTLNLSAR
jgi:hypothetical protein